MMIEIKRRPKMEPRGTLTLRGEEEEEELEKETGKEQSEERRKTKRGWYLGSQKKKVLQRDWSHPLSQMLLR